MNKQPLPPALRSLQHLRETKPELALPEVLPIDQIGTTYSMTQELSWLDSNHFAVGRWDGSMSIFQFNNSPTQGPLISEAVNTPSAEGVQMITWIAPRLFVTSNDAQSVIVWNSQSGQWNDLIQIQTLEYSSDLGVANSGTSYGTWGGDTLYLLIGHANGYVTIWSGVKDGSGLYLLKTVDVRSSNPTNPWGLHNVRGVSMIFWNGIGYAVSGSEDGDLCVISVPDGTILSRTVYNPEAQRGINSVATFGQNLLVANCSVGQSDYNLWYYWIESDWSIQFRGAERLQIDQSLPQVFNFDVIWGYYTGGLAWYSATEEGYLWMGTITSNQALEILGNQHVTQNLGAALGMSGGGNLAVAAYNLYQFNTQPDERPEVGEHPERFTFSPEKGGMR